MDLEDAIDRLIFRAENLQPLMKEIGAWWKDTAAPNQFDRQTEPGGTAWSPLTARYVAWKRKEGYDTRIGRQTGEMLKGRSFEASGRVVRLRFNAEHSSLFNAKRRLFPGKGSLPAPWLETCKREAIEHLRGGG